ncbi:hypothetical protein ACIA8K_23525 [Catenuloplanes sp. NPDC051500]|uniref:hypothetical protein n=1 Tax=Catenuloplanes sp. NPDC051500 TaxID=3363959 RepID=UPI00378B869B
MRTSRIGAATLLAVLAVTGCGAADDTPAPPVSAPPASTAASPTEGEATLTFPVDDAQVRQCEIFRGTSRLPENKTLILGVRNVDNGSPERYFQAVEDWEYPDDLVEWSGAQWFGSGDSSVGQRFRAEVLVVDLAQTKKAIHEADNKGWHSPDNPEGAIVAAHITLKRVAGPGPADCA